MAKQDRHLTTARLSAYIDGQLSTEEQVQSEEHLRTCDLCEQQLAELRQTVTLLHALPQPKLPRSFTLPVAEPVLAPQTNKALVRPLAPITPLRTRRGMSASLGGAIRVISTIAAVIGIFFLLSSLFGTIITLPRGGATSAGSASGGVASASTPQKATLPHFVTPRSTNITGQDVTPTPTSASSVTSPGTTHNQSQQPTHSQLTVFDILGSPLSRTIFGVVLVILGIIGFVVAGRRM